MSVCVKCPSCEWVNCSGKGSEPEFCSRCGAYLFPDEFKKAHELKKVKERRKKA